MGLLDKLLGRQAPANPTADWPTPPETLPVLTPSEGRVGDLAFGDPIEAARSFGRAEQYDWRQPDNIELLYPGSGLQLDFEAGRLVYLAVKFDQSQARPVLNIALPNGGTVALAHQTTKNDIESMFGPPGTADVDEEEIVLTYQTGAMTMEFELPTSTGTLARWDLFPTDP